MFFWRILFFQVNLVENYSSEIFWCRFLWFFSSDFSSDFFGKYCLFRVFIGTICGIIPRFLLGGLLQVLMKQNQTYFIEKHRIFPWYLPTVIFEQRMFWSRCCGIYDSYSSVTYLPKMFWILPGMFLARFVGNNLWEIPPKTGYGNMFQDIFTELFVDISYKFWLFNIFWLSLLKLFLKKLCGNTWSMS